MPPVSFRKRVDRVVGKFRILVDWQIYVDGKGNSNIHKQSWSHPNKPEAIIFPWDDQSPEHPEYILHEVLHVALAALERSDDKHADEERLVQDICAIYGEKK